MKVGSYVLRIYLEIIASLPVGVFIHSHDTYCHTFIPEMCL